jgi:hypothetical protein
MIYRSLNQAVVTRQTKYPFFLFSNSLSTIILDLTEMLERRSEVVERMKDLDEKAAPIIQFLQDPAHVDQLHPSDKSYNVQLLRERFNVSLSSVSVFELSSCFRSFEDAAIFAMSSSSTWLMVLRKFGQRVRIKGQPPDWTPHFCYTFCYHKFNLPRLHLLL